MRSYCVRLLVLPTVLLSACTQPARTHSYETLPQAATRDSLAAQRINQEGLTAIEAGDFESAENAFRGALEADLWYAPAHNNLGLVLLQKGRAYPAAWEFHYAAKLVPHSACPLNNLGLVLERVGRLDEAIDYYRRSLDISPDNIEVMGHLARAYVKSDRKDAAVRGLLKELAYRGCEGWDLWARRHLIRLDR